MSTIKGGQTPKGSETPKEGELPKKQELTIEDLLAEVRAPRPGEEASLETPIVAERTAGVITELIEVVPKSTE